SQLLRYRDLRVLSDHHTGEIGDVSPQGVNVPVSFDQNVDVEFHQTFQTEEPLPAVHVGIGCREVAPHEGITRQQHLLLRVMERDVVIAVAGSRDHLQVARFGVDGLAQQVIRVFQAGRLPDYRGAYPWELFE